MSTRTGIVILTIGGAALVVLVFVDSNEGMLLGGCVLLGSALIAASIADRVREPPDGN